MSEDAGVEPRTVATKACVSVKRGESSVQMGTSVSVCDSGDTGVFCALHNIIVFCINQQTLKIKGQMGQKAYFSSIYFRQPNLTILIKSVLIYFTIR